MGQTTFGEPLNYKVSQNAAAIEADEEAMAILATGDTHIAIGAGKYVYVRDHSTLARGLYKNTSGSTIAANGPLSSSNLTATTEGGLNELNSDINTLSSNISNVDTKHMLPHSTNTQKKSFSGSGNQSYSLVLTEAAMVTVTGYSGGTINIYANGDKAVCSAYAPSGWAQSSCGNSVYLKAGTHSVYYNGATSSSSAAVIVWG